MSENKQISTLTDLYRVNGGISIFSYYWKLTTNFKFCKISEDAGSVDNITYEEGHELASIISPDNNTDIWLTNSGNLMLKAIDSENYSIDTNGHLIYTE